MYIASFFPYDTPLETVKAYDPLGTSSTGRPKNVYVESPKCDPRIFSLRHPDFGEFAMGSQLPAHTGRAESHAPRANTDRLRLPMNRECKQLGMEQHSNVGWRP